MSKYTDAVERNLRGLRCASPGISPGCDECRGNFDNYTVRDESDVLEDGDELFTFDAAGYDGRPRGPRRAQLGVTHWRTEEEAEGKAREAFEHAVQNGRIEDESHFSWSGCGVCDSPLGGSLAVWHAVESDGEVRHFDDACVDCVMYLANGDEPTDREDEQEVA